MLEDIDLDSRIFSTQSANNDLARSYSVTMFHIISTVAKSCERASLKSNDSISKSQKTSIVSVFFSSLTIATSTSVFLSASEKAFPMNSTDHPLSSIILASNFLRSLYGFLIVSALSRHTMYPFLIISHAWMRCSSPFSNGGFITMRSKSTSFSKSKKSLPTIVQYFDAISARSKSSSIP